MLLLVLDSHKAEVLEAGHNTYDAWLPTTRYTPPSRRRKKRTIATNPGHADVWVRGYTPTVRIVDEATDDLFDLLLME